MIFTQKELQFEKKKSKQETFSPFQENLFITILISPFFFFTENGKKSFLVRLPFSSALHSADPVVIGFGESGGCLPLADPASSRHVSGSRHKLRPRRLKIKKKKMEDYENPKQNSFPENLHEKVINFLL